MWQKKGGEKEPSLASVGKGLVVRGEFSGEGDLQVGGELEGRIELVGSVVIREGARVQADISATEIVVAGMVQGNVTASGKVEVLATGQLLGVVQGKAVIIREGAVVDGRISMGPLPGPPGELAEIAALKRQEEPSDP